MVIARMQISWMYGMDASPGNVYAQQLWAACTLYQATGKEEHWNTTEDIYKKWIRNKQDETKKASPLEEDRVSACNLCLELKLPSGVGVQLWRISAVVLSANCHRR